MTDNTLEQQIKALRSQLSTVDATTQEGEPTPCGGIGKTVWYSFVAPADGTLAVDTIGSAFDTVLAVYDGPARSFADLTPRACNDAFLGAFFSRIEIGVTAGTTLFIQAGGFIGQSGPLVFNFAFTGVPAPPTPPQPSGCTATPP